MTQTVETVAALERLPRMAVIHASGGQHGVVLQNCDGVWYEPGDWVGRPTSTLRFMLPATVLYLPAQDADL